MALPVNSDWDYTLNVKSPNQLLSEAIGPLFVGFNISAALFGVICAQACLYFKRYSQDGTLKAIVVTLLLLETLNIALVAHGLFVCAISNHGSFRCFSHTVWSLVIQLIPSILIVAIVQYVWIMRIRTLSRSKRRSQVAIVMLSLVFIQMGMSITLAAIAYKSRKLGVIQSERWPVVASFILRTFNDISLTGLLCYHLQRYKNGLRATDSIIHKLMGYGLRAGLFNCMGSIATMILLVVMPKRLVYAGVYLVFSRMYTNSLLAMLNWRRSPPEADLEGSERELVELSTVDWGPSISSRVMPLTIPELENM